MDAKEYLTERGYEFTEIDVGRDREAYDEMRELSDQTYVPTLSVGGSTVYNNGGAPLSHYSNTRYMAEGWIGTDPQIIHIVDVAYLRSTLLVPNYVTAPSSTVMTALIQTYTQMSNGPITQASVMIESAPMPKTASLFLRSRSQASCHGDRPRSMGSAVMAVADIFLKPLIHTNGREWCGILISGF